MQGIRRGPVLSSGIHGPTCYFADLKGGNVLLSDGPEPGSLVAKVADFGLARDVSAASRIQAAKYGTITHMPPELLTDGTLTKVSRSPRMSCAVARQVQRCISVAHGCQVVYAASVLSRINSLSLSGLSMLCCYV